MSKFFSRVPFIAAIMTAVFFGGGCGSITPPPSPHMSWPDASRWRGVLGEDTALPSMDDEGVDFSRPLELMDVLKTALRNNPDTREAWEKTREAYARMKQAGRYYYPELTVSADVSRQKQDSDEAALDYDLLKYGPGARITMLLLDAGGRRAGVEAAARDLLASNFRFDASIQDLILEAEKAYHELYSSVESMKAVKSDVEDSRKVLEATRRKLEAGLAVRLDVLQAQSNYEEALYNLADAEYGVNSAQAGLARVMGFAAGRSFEIREPDIKPPLELDDKNVARLIEEALRNNPDLAAARASLEAREFAVRRAESALWPSLNLEGSAARNWVESYHDNPAGDNYEYAAYVSIRWSVFDGFHNLNIRRAAQAEMAAERERLKKAELQASMDVWAKYHMFKADVQKLKHSEAYLESSEESYALAHEGYAAGLKNILDLLYSQTQLASARSRLVEARKNLYISFAELLRAIGSLGYSGDPGDVAEVRR